MKLKKLLENVDIISSSANVETDVNNVRFDSRRVGSGDLFMAVCGHDSDGNSFRRQAKAAGAAVIVSAVKKPAMLRVPYIQVRDDREAAALIAANSFGNPAKKLKIIGVTGTSGKTTTTHILKSVIEAATGRPCGLIGTNSNFTGAAEYPSELTTPGHLELHRLFSEMVSAGCEYCVMEVSSHALVQKRVFGLTFDAAVYTNLSHEHLDEHNTMDEYANAKALIFAQSRAAVINADDAYAGIMLAAAENAGCEVSKYSVNGSEDAQFFAKDLKLLPETSEFIILRGAELVRSSVGMPGIFNVYNALAAAAALCVCGFSLAETAKQIGAAPPVKGRLERYPVPESADFSIYIDYAHKPEAMQKVLEAMADITPGRLIALFGCGGDRDKDKRPEMGRIAIEQSDFVIITSDNPRTEDPDEIIREIAAGIKDGKDKYTVITDRKEAIRYGVSILQPSDTLMLLGKGHEDYIIIGKEKRHFDEREVVADALEEFFSEPAEADAKENPEE
ncbi:MAG: UDP-N-acetylmuramoyl-L-alanyl-D-glutamate--2,6-diaminopimelate ligase [Oscillospiraceae bacterium]|jgi:UDP-N-acetylmuramoyl-L-alanyl-D-glutamate--2,6-diaminopimelate ligase|nr:UDP-N-acetylmuramoyl-L-alanyl-D-glutamate--2,6-diaminopimelate ligase [Oscillospiraceae bacterium]